MAVEFGQVPDFVGLVLVDRVEMLHKALYERLFVELVDLAETLSQKTKELLVDALHHAALHDHVAELILVALGDIRL